MTTAVSPRIVMVAALTVAVAAAACTRTSSRGGTEAGTPAPSLDQATVFTDAAARAGTSGQLDPEAARERRAALVQSIAASGVAKSPRVIDAMRRVPRHLFVPGASLEEAYEDRPVGIGSGQTISQPTVVAEMTDALELGGSERVLEIGTGSGYQAAILSHLAREVYTIELLPELGERAETRLRDLGYSNVRVRVGDGYAGWPEHGPFDRVILTAAPPEIPRALLDQLAEGGVLIAPVGEEHGVQELVRIRKKDGTIRRERLASVRFVPMVPGKKR